MARFCAAHIGLLTDKTPDKLLVLLNKKLISAEF